MRKNVNEENIEGYLYQQNLQFKKVQDQTSANYGKEFITGNIEVATDEDCLNVLSVHYTYVTELTKNGKKNATFTALKRIYDNPKTVIVDGKDAAIKVKLSPSAALNDFYPQGQDTLVSQPRNEGGFVTIVDKLTKPPKNRPYERNKFTFDMLMTHVKHIDADPEKHIDNDYTEIRGAIFNFRNDLLPFTVVAKTPAAMKYFEETLSISEKEPVYMQIWGSIVNTNQVIEKTIESAFGEAAVDITQKRVREWVVEGGSTTSYPFDDSSTITAEELTKAVQDRNVMLASIKKRRDDYEAKKAATNDSPVAAAADFMNVPTNPPLDDVPVGNFKF